MKQTLVVVSTVFILFMHACAGLPVPPAKAKVYFEVAPPQARIYVEERYLGPARAYSRAWKHPAEFSNGTRHFTFTAEGYFPHDIEVNLPAGGEADIKVELRPIP